MAERSRGCRQRPAKRPRILVTNDDGINAPGLRILERVARELSTDVWVVAPETNQSGASHSLTMHRPLRIRKVSRRRFAIDGTPTDCVLLALQTVIKNGPVDLVLSGVNHGGQPRRGRHLFRHHRGGDGGDPVQCPGVRAQPKLPQRPSGQMGDRRAARARHHLTSVHKKTGRRIC